MNILKRAALGVVFLALPAGFLHAAQPEAAASSSDADASRVGAVASAVVDTGPELPVIGGGEIVAAQVVEYAEAITRDEVGRYIAAVAEAEAAEAARVAAAEAAARAVSRPAPRPITTGSGGPTSCDGHVVPGYILERESGCSYDAYNASGCDGAGCIGLYQLHAMHFAPGGACAGMGTDPAGQDACASKISGGGSNLNPWASTR